MKRIIIFIIILSTVNVAWATSEAENLKNIDKQDNPNIIYKPYHYQFIIEKLKEYTTATDEREIAVLIFKAYSELEKEFPGLTLYEVADGIKQTGATFYYQDNNRKQNVNNMAAVYMAMKQLEKRGL